MVRGAAKAEYLRGLAATPALLLALLLSGSDLELWYAVALGAGLAGWLLKSDRDARRALRRVKTGLCPACGYDLRASPERCPECGTAVWPPEPPALTRL